MNNRTAMLESLLNLDKPIGKITTALSEFGWDSDELVVIEIHHIGQILERYLSGEFDESVVEAWADAIECRDDIGISQEGKDDIEELIYELANPDLVQRLTPERAKNLVARSHAPAWERHRDRSSGYISFMMLERRDPSSVGTSLLPRWSVGARDKKRTANETLERCPYSTKRL